MENLYILYKYGEYAICITDLGGMDAPGYIRSQRYQKSHIPKFIYIRCHRFQKSRTSEVTCVRVTDFRCQRYQKSQIKSSHATHQWFPTFFDFGPLSFCRKA